MILLGSLLVSPLGWVYYLPLAAGPLLACLRSGAAWIGFWISAYMLLLFRSNFMANLHLSAVGAVTIGSIYAWALLLLFLASRTRATTRPLA